MTTVYYAGEKFYFDGTLFDLKENRFQNDLVFVKGDHHSIQVRIADLETEPDLKVRPPFIFESKRREDGPKNST